MNMIRWIDMVDPVYTLAKLAGVDPDELRITGIIVMDNHMSIWYQDEKGIARHKTVGYSL